MLWLNAGGSEALTTYTKRPLTVEQKDETNSGGPADPKQRQTIFKKEYEKNVSNKRALPG